MLLSTSSRALPVEARSRSRGPDGSRSAPNTPWYTTPADYVVANLGELKTALAGLASAGAASGGKVVEVTGDLTGDASLGTAHGSASWATNVLVRPPLGQRAQVSCMLNDSPNLTVAGFDFVADLHTTAAMQSRASRMGFWRCIEDAGIGKQIKTNGSDTEDQFYVECVMTEWVFNAIGDSFRIGGAHNIARPLFDGCHWTPKIFGVTLTDWTVNPTTYTNPGAVIDYYEAGELSVESGIPVETVADDFTFGPPALALVVWLDEGAQGQPVIVDVKVDGVLWQTVTLDRSADYRYQVVRSINRNFTAGQVITADVTQVGSTRAGSGLHILAGVDAQAGPSADGPDLHGDMLQFFSGATWTDDPTIRDTVMAGSNGKAIQIEDTRGDFTYDNVFIGRHSGSSEEQPGSNSADGLTDHHTDCVFARATNLNAAGIGTFTGNSAADFTGTLTPDGTNTERGVSNILPEPDLPDLAAVWPECPPT